jgi:hypothetical protein
LAPPRQKKGPQVESDSRPLWNKSGGDLRSHIVSHAVSSALEGLTAVFGMGTGVAPPPGPPESGSDRRGGRSGKGEKGVLCVAWLFRPPKIPGQAARPISTGQLHPLPGFHLLPINLVVCEGSSGSFCCGRSHLGASFTLRCIQRLSQPDLTTQRCSWRNNWYISGPSNPVLSY